MQTFVINVETCLPVTLLCCGARSLSLHLTKHCSAIMSTKEHLHPIVVLSIASPFIVCPSPMPASTSPNGLTKRYTRHCVQKCSRQHSKNLPGEHTVTSLQRFQPYNALGEARSGSPQLVIQQILMYTYTGF